MYCALNKTNMVLWIWILKNYNKYIFWIGFHCLLLTPCTMWNAPPHNVPHFCHLKSQFLWVHFKSWSEDRICECKCVPHYARVQYYLNFSTDKSAMTEQPNRFLMIYSNCPPHSMLYHQGTIPSLIWHT